MLKEKKISEPLIKITNNPNILCILGLLILSFIFFFYGIGDYRLIDIDETRYINIARAMHASGDYITPVLNFEPFFEKPPLFYWLTCLSYKIFNSTGLFASRFPLALIGAAGVFGTYFFVKNIVKSALAAFLSAVVLMSAFWYGLFCHIGLLDSTFCVLTTLAFYFGVSTLFVSKEYQKRLLWYIGYFFLALSVLQKGFIGIIAAGCSLLAVFIVLRRAKEIIKPSYIIPGVLIFLLAAAPWHYISYKINGELWFNDYIVKHHFARFANSSMDIGRKQHFLFYVPVFLGGIMPWSAFLIYGIIRLINKIKKTKFEFLKNSNDNFQTLNLICIVWFFVIFIFFSISSTKLPTYILPCYPPAAILLGIMFYNFIKYDKYKKGFIICAIITYIAFILAGIAAITAYFLNVIGQEFIPLALSFIIFPFFGFYAIKKYNKGVVFNIVMAFSLLVVGLNQHYLFNFVTSFGQTELEEYAKIAEADNALLAPYKVSKKYCYLNHYKKHKIYLIPGNSDMHTLPGLLSAMNDAKKENKTLYMIIPNKKIKNSPYVNFFELVRKDKKYSLYKRTLR